MSLALSVPPPVKGRGQFFLRAWHWLAVFLGGGFALWAGAVSAAPFAYILSNPLPLPSDIPAQSGRLVIIDVQTGQMNGPPIPIASEPNKIAVSRDGAKAYVTSRSQQNLAVIDIPTRKILYSFPFRDAVLDIVLSPNGEALYAALEESLALQNSKKISKIIRIDTASLKVTHEIALPDLLNVALAIDRDASRLYAAGIEGEGEAGNRLLAIDLDTMNISAQTLLPARSGGQPGGWRHLVLSPDGEVLYLSNPQNELLAAVATDNLGLRAVQDLEGQSPGVLALDNSGRTLYVTRQSDSMAMIYDTRTGLNLLSSRQFPLDTQAIALSAANITLFTTSASQNQFIGLGVDNSSDIPTLSVTVPSPSGFALVGQVPSLAVTTLLQNGWWWNPEEPGRGLSFEITPEGRMFLAGYMYEIDETPIWYLGLGQYSRNQFVDELRQFANGQSLLGPFRPAEQLPTSPGPLALMALNPRHAVLDWPGGPILLERFEFSPEGVANGPAAGMPETGWWYNESEPGSGTFFEVQNTRMFMAAYSYDNRGQASWNISLGEMNGTQLYEGVLQRCEGGQILGGGFLPARCLANQGQISIFFTSSTTALLTLPNGRQVPLSRYRF
jgi:DNA-binding beta-propeller fold protein YncE